MGAVAATTVILLLDLAALFFWLREKRWHNASQWLRPAAFFAGWIVFVLFELLDIPHRGRLYVSSTVLDHSYRVAFLQSLAAHGIPAINPLYFPGSAQPLHYYYFWYALLALPLRLFALDPRCVLIASCILCGLGVAAIVVLYVREWMQEEHLTPIALGLLAVTGLDVLPVIANLATGVPLDADPEWWSTDQVTSWLDTLLWVPHHCAGLIALLTAVLLLWMSRKKAGRELAIYVVAAGAALASTFGLSIYLGITVGLVLLAWAVQLAIVERDLRSARSVLLSLMVAALCSAPFLLELHATQSHGSAASGIPLQLGVREMVHADVLTGLPFLSGAMHSHPVLTEQAVRALLLLPGYFVELGVFGVALAFWWIHLRHRPANDPIRALVFFACVSAVISTLLRSTAIHNNDFGYRSILILQFFALLLTAKLIADWKQKGSQWNWRSIVFAGMLGVGLVSTLFQAVVLRMYNIVRPQNTVMAYQLYDAYSHLQSIAGADDVVQWSPSPALTSDLQPERIQHALNLLYARHQTAATDEDCGAVFGGDAHLCSALQSDLQTLYRGEDAADAQQVCNRWHISFLVTTKDDAAWDRKNSWVWTLPVVIRESHVRIVRCQN